jgi:hypothetical protein
MRWVVLFLLVVVVGCGTSPESLIDEYRPAIEKMREKLKLIQDKIPQTAENVTAELSPKLILNEESPDHNCETIMYSALQGEKGAIDLMLTTNLSTTLYWANQAPSGGDQAFMKRVMDGATKAKYLIVHRIDEGQLPIAVSEQEFVAAPVRVDGFVFELDTLTIVASYVVEAIPADQVSYSFKHTESAKDRLQAFAQSSVWSDARVKIAEAIVNSTGGEVRLR